MIIASLLIFCFTVVYSVVRPADDSENLKIVEFKRLSPHRESIRCLINVAGSSRSWIKWIELMSTCKTGVVLSCASSLWLSQLEIHNSKNSSTWCIFGVMKYQCMWEVGRAWEKDQCLGVQLRANLALWLILSLLLKCIYNFTNAQLQVRNSIVMVTICPS